MINAMVTILEAQKASAFPFNEQQTGVIYKVFCDTWHVEWGLRRWDGRPAPFVLLRHAVGRVRQGQRSDRLMGVRPDVTQLAPLEIVEMFVWMTTADRRLDGPVPLASWHQASRHMPITWQGVTYEPFPIEADRFRNAGDRQAAAADDAGLQHRRRARRLPAHHSATRSAPRSRASARSANISMR